MIFYWGGRRRILCLTKEMKPELVTCNSQGGRSEHRQLLGAHRNFPHQAEKAMASPAGLNLESLCALDGTEQVRTAKGLLHAGGGGR